MQAEQVHTYVHIEQHRITGRRFVSVYHPHPHLVYQVGDFWGLLVFFFVFFYDFVVPDHKAFSYMLVLLMPFWEEKAGCLSISSHFGV